MDKFLEQMHVAFGQNVPTVVAAVFILVGGWLAAFVVSVMVRSALKRTSLDNRFANWLRGEKKEKVEVEKWVGRVVFWILMLLVAVGFFQVLGLTMVTEPLNRFLGKVFQFGPQLLAAAVLIGLAWVLARSLRFIVTRTLGAKEFKERLGGATGLDDNGLSGLVKTIGKTVYWLVFLLFLPALLGALQLNGLLEPVQSMLERALVYLPNIFGALLILAIGWFVARLVQRIVTSLLAAMGADKLGERVGMDGVLGTKKLSWVLGTVVHVLILIPVLVAALNALQLEAITQPASAMLNQLLSALPMIFGAVLILVLAYVVGRLVTGPVANILAGAGLDATLVKIGLAKEDAKPKQKPSYIASYLVLVTIMLLASIEAAGMLGFEVLAVLIADFLVFLGHIFFGLVIFGLGLFLAKLAARTLEASASDDIRRLALPARGAVIILAAAMALRHMGLANEIVNLAFGLLLGSVAVAVAIAYGLGGREIAARQLERWVASREAQKASDSAPATSPAEE